MNMKNTVRSFILAGSAMVMLHSCKTNLKTEDVSSGSADFSRYVAIGNSLTAGYADGALSLQGQINSYPHMLSTQFMMVGGSNDFSIPYMNEGGGNDGSGNPRRTLGYVIPCGSNSASIAPVFDPNGSTPFNNIAANGPYNLVGVPGARAIDAINPIYSALNPFLQRYCQTPGVSTMLTEALRSKPSFFTLWLGSNDALLYATGGAVPPANIFSPALSDTTQVRVALQQMVDSLVQTGAKGAIANVPDVTSIPYFTTVPWNSVVLSQGKADTLNQLYASVGLTAITWNAGANGLMIADSAAGTTSGFMRHATANDLILLTTPGDSIRCGQWGISPVKPLADRYVLDVAEKNQIQSYITNYNAAIASIAISKGLALVDMNKFMKTFKSGIVYNGIGLNATFVSGGGFSLDGVHPTPRGYALIANEFISSINKKFGSTIPQVDVTKYNGVVFPR
jgi:lysophospholipase L1-like esterase